jgi:hypothetical protein
MGVQFNFNASQYNPSFGGVGSLPAGKYKVIIAESDGQKTKDEQGGFLALTLKVIEGPLTGGQHVDRLNLYNVNQQTVQIANERLSGYCYVTGTGGFNNTAELHNKPFCVEIGPQKNDPQYTEVKKLLMADGSQPSAGGGQQQQQTQQPQGFGGQQQQPQGGYGQNPNPPPQNFGGGQPPPNNGGNWQGGNNGGAPPQQQQNWQGGGQPGGAAPGGGGAPWGRS